MLCVSYIVIHKLYSRLWLNFSYLFIYFFVFQRFFNFFFPVWEGVVLLNIVVYENFVVSSVVVQTFAFLSPIREVLVLFGSIFKAFKIMFVFYLYFYFSKVYTPNKYFKKYNYIQFYFIFFTLNGVTLLEMALHQLPFFFFNNKNCLYKKFNNYSKKV